MISAAGLKGLACMDNNAIEMTLNYLFNQRKGIYHLGNKTLQIQMGR